MLSTQELSEIKARVEGATPEPWKSLGSLVLDGSEIVASCHIRSDDMTPSRVGDMSRANARLIAACCTDLPRLIEAYEEMVKVDEAVSNSIVELHGRLRSDIRKAKREERQAIIEMLEQKRDRYTTPHDPRFNIINSDIEAIKQRDL